MLGAIIIDPAILAIPNLAENETDVEEIFLRIVGWAANVVREAPLRVVQPSGTAAALAEANAFPAGENVKALIDLFQVGHVFSAEHIRRSIVAILTRAAPVAETIGFEVLECQVRKARPNILDEYPAGSVRDAAMCSIATTLLSPHLDLSLFFAHGFAPATGVIECECSVSHTSPANTPLTCPFSAEGRVPLVASYRDALELLEPGSVWEGAENEDELHLAISLEAVRILRASGKQASLDDVPNFFVGGRFFASIRQWQAARAESHAAMVRETCARLILGIPKNEVTDFRDDKGHPRRRDDGALAQRSHVSKSHEALRLMHWQHRDGIELANVGPKNELTIEDGRAGRTGRRLW